MSRSVGAIKSKKRPITIVCAFLLLVYFVTAIALQWHFLHNPTNRINFTVFLPDKGQIKYPQLLVEGYGEITNVKAVLNPNVAIGYSVYSDDSGYVLVQQKANGSTACSDDAWNSCQVVTTGAGQSYLRDVKDVKEGLKLERIRFEKEGTSVTITQYVDKDILNNEQWNLIIQSLAPSTISKEQLYYVHDGDYKVGPSSFLPVGVKVWGIYLWEYQGIP